MVASTEEGGVAQIMSENFGTGEWVGLKDLIANAGGIHTDLLS